MGANAGMGMSALGVGISSAGAENAAQSQQNALRYESEIAGNNAQIAEYQAGLAKENTRTNVGAVDLKGGEIFGEQRAQMAANGVDLGTGSASEVLATTKYMTQRDANIVQDTGNRQAWAYQTEATNWLNQKSALNTTADNIHPWMAGLTTALTGASSVANSYYSPKAMKSKAGG